MNQSELLTVPIVIEALKQLAARRDYLLQKINSLNNLKGKILKIPFVVDGIMDCLVYSIEMKKFILIEFSMRNEKEECYIQILQLDEDAEKTMGAFTKEELLKYRSLPYQETYYNQPLPMDPTIGRTNLPS